jgi:hypothetical protein
MVAKTALALVPGSAAQARSAAHKRFYTLRERIAKARQGLLAWHEGLPAFAMAYDARVVPVLKMLDEARRSWAFELEQLRLGQRWNAAEIGVLDGMILDICRSLLGREGARDPELVGLFNRVAEVDWETERARHFAALRASLEARCGADLSDFSADSVDELIEEARRRMAEKAQAQAPAPAAEEPRPKKRARKSPGKPAAAEAESAGTGIRAVYRRLVTLLHPDRTPAGAPDAERQTRHEQMSRANAAYAAGDLLTLLTLRWQWEPTDREPAEQFTDSQVRQFNQVLARELEGIEDDIREREDAFGRTYGYLPDRRPDPRRLPELLKDALREAQSAQARLLHDQRLMRSDPVGLRRLLKELAREQRAQALLRSGW